MRGRWEVSDAEWSVLEPILQPARRKDGRGRPWRDTRAVLNGVLWVLGTGAQWRELPNKYPPYQTCHRRFQQWVRDGKLEKILRLLATELQARGAVIGWAVRQRIGKIAAQPCRLPPNIETQQASTWILPRPMRSIV